MKMMYMTRRFHAAKIEQIEVVKETEKTVTHQYQWGERVIERRLYKDAGGDRIHATWEDAHAHLMTRAEQRVESARIALQRAHDELGNVKGMKKPEGV